MKVAAEVQKLCLAAGLFILIAGAPAAFGGSVYITGWVATSSSGGNDIYTNLNEQFPNTGAGTPGSETGTADATYLYDPATYTATDIVTSSDVVTNGISFELASNSTGQDFMQLGAGGEDPSTLSITTVDGTNSLDVTGISTVYLLTASYFGTTYSVTFTGTGGATETFSDVSTPNFCNGGSLNTTSGGALDQTVLEVQDVGACVTGNSTTGTDTNYYLYEQTFTLNSSFDGQALTGISITGGDTLLLLGITTDGSQAASTAPEPATFGLLGFGLIGLVLFKRHGKSPRRDSPPV